MNVVQQFEVGLLECRELFLVRRIVVVEAQCVRLVVPEMVGHDIAASSHTDRKADGLGFERGLLFAVFLCYNGFDTHVDDVQDGTVVVQLNGGVYVGVVPSDCGSFVRRDQCVVELTEFD